MPPIQEAPSAPGSFASRLKLDLALMDYREENGAYPKIVGNVKRKKVIILDDLIDTGRTVLRTTNAAKCGRGRDSRGLRRSSGALRSIRGKD